MVRRNTSVAAGLLLLAVSQHGMAAEPGLGSLLLSEAALRRAEMRGDAYNPAGRPALPVAAPPDAAAYVIPAAEILAFQYLLNRFDHAFVGPEYDVSSRSIRRNLRSSWVEDQDPFAINQIGHPYQGAMYFGFARSAGLGFWQSMAYTFAGSAVWEIAGETTPPSRNDQITTSFAGSFLGESLYRMAHLALESGGPWRELAAAAISPPVGFNRLVFPDRFAAILASRDPATFSRVQVGASGSRNTTGATREIKRNEGFVDYLLDYGLPGKPGYAYRQPFDYFSFQVRASTVRGIESVHNRGLIVGRSYEAGPSYRGIWGLYGSFDFLAPQLFRLSSTALSLGTTGQWRLSDALALQGTATAGAGFTNTGTIRPTAERDYNYGFAPQIMLSLRALFGDAVSFDTSLRRYYAGRLATREDNGRDRVLRGDATLTVRLRGPHAVALKYVTSRRESSFEDLGDRTQRRDTLGLYYTYLPGKGFGMVE